jgi:hypothetical protein
MEGFISIEISRSADNHASAKAVRLTTKDDRNIRKLPFCEQPVATTTNTKKIKCSGVVETRVYSSVSSEI